jgi:hypothetical protein
VLAIFMFRLLWLGPPPTFDWGLARTAACPRLSPLARSCVLEGTGCHGPRGAVELSAIIRQAAKALTPLGDGLLRIFRRRQLPGNQKAPPERAGHPLTRSSFHPSIHGVMKSLKRARPRPADSDEVARAFRDDVARCSDMMSPGVRGLLPYRARRSISGPGRSMR